MCTLSSLVPEHERAIEHPWQGILADCAFAACVLSACLVIWSVSEEHRSFAAVLAVLCWVSLLFSLTDP